MPRVIPIQVFEASETPVLAVDLAGTILYANPATSRLFAPAGDLVQGRSCWRVTRLRGTDGRAFCSPNCPVRRQARLGKVPATEDVTLPAGRAADRRFDLLNFLVPAVAGAGCLVLHLLLPGRGDAAPLSDVRTRPRTTGGHLQLLSPRELQVLEGLAGGLDAAGVADRFAITLNTARNHIRSILRKLDVHRQVDAVLLLLGQLGDARVRFHSSERRAS